MAGGLSISYADGRGNSVNHNFVLNSEFIENFAGIGGGVYYFSPGRLLLWHLKQ